LCVAAEITSGGINHVAEAYVDKLTKTFQMYDWQKRVHVRRDSVDDDTRRSCPSTSKMEQILIVWERL